MSDIVQIKRLMTDRARAIAEYLLPNGQISKNKREWEVGSINGEAGQSLKICVSGQKAGVWTDFAEGGEGGDLIQLWMNVRHINLPTALDEIRSYLRIETPKFERKSKEWKRPAKPQCNTPKSAVLDHLTGERKLSLDAIRAYRVGENGRVMVFPFLRGSELVLVKYRDVDRNEKGKQPTRASERDCEPILFGWQAIDTNAREITLTEGEIDAMTAWDYGYPALSLPFGGGKGSKQQWIESEFDHLAQFEKIYLALDMDEEGELAAREICSRLGEHRCFRVHLPHKDLNECRQKDVSASEIAAAFTAAKTLDPEELRRAGEFTDQVIELFHPTSAEQSGYWLPFEKLKDLVRFRPGELSIWTGPSGHGKSQVLSHASVEWGYQGARVCIASLEMAPRQLLKRMVKQAGNVDRPTHDYIRAIMQWLDDWLWLVAIVGKMSPGAVIKIFEYARARYGCDTFIIDSLMRLGVGSEDYEGQEKAIYEMLNWAVEKGVHLHLVAHSRKQDTKHGGNTAPETEDIKGASEIGSNAFNILSVWRNRKQEGQIQDLEEKLSRGDIGARAALDQLLSYPGVTLNVAKQRNGDYEGKTGLWFNQETYQYRAFEDAKSGFDYVKFGTQPDDDF